MIDAFNILLSFVNDFNDRIKLVFLLSFLGKLQVVLFRLGSTIRIIVKGGVYLIKKERILNRLQLL